MKAVECYVDINVPEGQHRVYIRHDEHPCDAVIRVDEKKVTPTSKVLPDGGALIFFIGSSQIIITIIKENNGYDYDCFVDGRSIKNDMPWVLERNDLPTVLKWKKKKSVTMGKYVLTEAIKGALIGCVVFFILCLLQYFVPAMRDVVNYWYLLFSVLPLGLLYAVLSPMEYNSKTKSLDEYLKYKNGKKDESEKRSDDYVDLI